MKKILFTASVILILGAACKSKKTSASTDSANAALDNQLAAAKTRFPDVTRQELQKGQAVYTGACTKCHAPKNVTAYTEPRLLEIVDVMAKKAEISAEEKQALIRFAVGVRATSK